MRRRLKEIQVMRELTTIAHLQDQADGSKDSDSRRRRRGYFSNLF